MQLIRNQKTFRWYGKEGVSDHVIKVPEAEYEIGVTQRNDCYELNCDFYDRNLEKKIGSKGGLLKQAYAVMKTRIEARKKGYSVLERKTENSIKLHVRIS